MRECPNCSARSIRLPELLLSDCHCPACGALVGVHWAAYFGFTIVTFAAASVTTIMVLMQSGLYAALLWFPFPVGSLSYIKARFAPLQAKEGKRGV